MTRTSTAETPGSTVAKQTRDSLLLEGYTRTVSIDICSLPAEVTAANAYHLLKIEFCANPIPKTLEVARLADGSWVEAEDEESTDDDTQKTVMFITNKKLRDRQVKSTVSRYRRHWSIENSCKTIKEFLTRTISKTYVVRLFYFAFAVLLYSCWLLVDVLVRDVETVMAYEPEVTAKRILAAMTQYLRSVA
jgi:hypothetical protein